MTPFATETLDRSQPALLQSLQRIDEYRAARANLQQIVDVEQDAKLAALLHQGRADRHGRAGDVDATVDFRTIGPKAVRSPPSAGVVITLPAARLSRARLDLTARASSTTIAACSIAPARLSATVARTISASCWPQAQRKLDTAARADRDCCPRPSATPRRCCEARPCAGYERVTVRFEKPPVV